jgi:hypothetical protein
MKAYNFFLPAIVILITDRSKVDVPAGKISKIKHCSVFFAFQNEPNIFYEQGKNSINSFHSVFFSVFHILVCL